MFLFSLHRDCTGIKTEVWNTLHQQERVLLSKKKIKLTLTETCSIRKSWSFLSRIDLVLYETIKDYALIPLNVLNAPTHFIKLKTKHIVTFRWGGILQLHQGVSWPWGDHEQSFPRRNRPPRELWADALEVSSAAGRSVSPRRCCRSCQSVRYTDPPEIPVP